MKNYILISAAVTRELGLIKKSLSNPEEFTLADRGLTRGMLGDKDVLLVPTGPGLVNTAHALTAVIEKCRPLLIIQTGCAGAFARAGLEKGDIGVASCEIDVNSGIEAEDSPFGLPVSPLPFSLVPKGNQTATNQFPTHPELSQKAFDILSGTIKAGQKIVSAPFITLSTITATDKRAGLLYDSYKACMESMEGSAAAQIAFLYEIPFIEIRSASNLVGKRDKNNWDLPLAFNQSNRAVLNFINQTDELL